MKINDLTYLIRGAAFSVFKKLGPGLLESIYQKALEIELTKLGLDVKSELPIGVQYEGEDLGLGFRIDLLVCDTVVVELKSIMKLEKVHFKQLLTYLKITNKRCGLLINFNVDDLSKGIHRMVN